MTSWLLKEAKFGRLPLLETTISSLSSTRCAPFSGKISGVTGQFKWRDWNLSPDVIDSFTRRYWTISPDFTGQFHLALLDRITWRYWTVSPCVTETYHMTLLRVQDSNRAVQYATTNSLNCDCFLKWSQSTWQIFQWHKKISWSRFMDLSLPYLFALGSFATFHWIYRYPVFFAPFRP